MTKRDVDLLLALSKKKDKDIKDKRPDKSNDLFMRDKVKELLWEDL